METSYARRVAALVLLVAVQMMEPVAAFDLTSCSKENTGSGHQVLNTIYLSLGKCHDTCEGQNYAFGIVQGDYCWCSNEAPGSTVDTSECDTTCPGWPYEFCASSDAGVYGYIALSNSPSGTANGGDSESSAAPTTVTVLATVSTPESEPTTTVWISFLGGYTSSPISSSSFQIASSDTLQTPVATAAQTVTDPPSSATTIFETPYVSVKTVLGSAQTITVSPTNEFSVPAVTQPPLPSSEPSDADPFWSNTGKVAGTFTVVGLLIAGLIGAAIFLVYRRHRSRNQDAMTVASTEDQPTSSSGAPYMVDRRRSNLTLQTGGLAGLTRGSSHEKSPVDNNNNNKTPASMSRRGSIPMSHDQRLNPAALYDTVHGNGSRASVNTFQDERDYSRPVLHVRNPDTQ